MINLVRFCLKNDPSTWEVGRLRQKDELKLSLGYINETLTQKILFKRHCFCIERICVTSSFVSLWLRKHSLVLLDSVSPSFQVRVNESHGEVHRCLLSSGRARHGAAQPASCTPPAPPLTASQEVFMFPKHRQTLVMKARSVVSSQHRPGLIPSILLTLCFLLEAGFSLEGRKWIPSIIT